MKNILIVESGAKAKTLQRYLGKGWSVVATGGHVETLPFDRRLHGKDASKAFWASGNGSLPAPPWVWTDRGEEAVRSIVKAADGNVDVAFWVATDPDREGEFIAWCLERHLDGEGPVRRVTFQEVTREALEAALERPRGVDGNMVESALVRKFLDRLVGYRTSKMANAIVPGGKASMGRVQTPTLGFVVERELEREAHVPIPYFEVRARAEGVDFDVRFHEPDDADAWRGDGGKFDPARTSDRALADRAYATLLDASVLRLTAAEPSTRRREPDAPFTTDALLQAAGSRFGWSPRKTSALASMLYEAGHITYIRTDSTRLAAAAIDRARAVIAEAWGTDHLGAGARAEATAGPVQDAHEAIRPSRLEVDEPTVEDADARRLYRLIRAHTLASRMAPSVRQVVSLEAACDGLDRRLKGTVWWRTFAGWEAAYAEFLGDVAVAPPAVELEAGAAWRLDPSEKEAENPRLIEDATKPPARFRAHTLIRAMKEAGIGRPSTYSSTVDKLEDRGYITLEDGSVVPTERGRGLWLDAAPLYVEEAPEGDSDGSEHVVELFSPTFTAAMEEELDRIANGEVPAPATWERWRDRVRTLHESARAQRDSGEISASQKRTLKGLLANAAEVVDAEGIKVPHDVATLSYVEARDLIRTLREAGVQPAPTESQLGYLERLIADLDLDEEELVEVVGFRTAKDVGRLTTVAEASAAIDALRQLHDERRPPSAKQRRFIDGLLEQTGIAAEEAAEAVGVATLDDLTGGKGGTASELIDWLQARVPRKEGDPG